MIMSVIYWIYAIALSSAYAAFSAPSRFEASIVSAGGGFGLPGANVTLSSHQSNSCSCAPSTQLVAVNGFFSLECDAACGSINITVWARQFVPLQTELRATPTPVRIALTERAIPSFPAKEWRFDGWVIEAQTGNVPGTDISFLAHPSAYRTPSGRIFVISTAHGYKETAWTQGYWQEAGGIVAKALPFQLINSSHPVVLGVPFSARLVFAEGRLLMLVGYGRVSLLENKNLNDPSRPEDWVAAEGDGHLIVNFTGAPTSKHEDYRLHVLDDAPSDVFGRHRKYWLLAVPDDTEFPGRACGRMAFTAEKLIGPYTYGGWWYQPEGSGTPGGPTSNCQSWPGDLLQTALQRYHVAGWGQIYSAERNGSVLFSRLKGNGMITTVPPSPAFDDVHQIEFTFLPPAAGGDGRWRMYHASYSSENSNPNATRADCGFKQAIGMYSFACPTCDFIVV